MEALAAVLLAAPGHFQEAEGPMAQLALVTLLAKARLFSLPLALSLSLLALSYSVCVHVWVPVRGQGKSRVLSMRHFQEAEGRMA